MALITEFLDLNPLCRYKREEIPQALHVFFQQPKHRELLWGDRKDCVRHVNAQVDMEWFDCRSYFYGSISFVQQKQGLKTRCVEMLYDAWEPAIVNTRELSASRLKKT